MFCSPSNPNAFTKWLNELLASKLLQHPEMQEICSHPSSLLVTNFDLFLSIFQASAPHVSGVDTITPFSCSFQRARRLLQAGTASFCTFCHQGHFKALLLQN